MLTFVTVKFKYYQLKFHSGFFLMVEGGLIDHAHHSSHVSYQTKIIEGEGVKIPKDPVQTFNLVFENQPIASGILTQPSCYRAICLLTKKVPNRGIQIVVWLYMYIYGFICSFNILIRNNEINYLIDFFDQSIIFRLPVL